MVGREHSLHVLGIEPLGPRGEADQVGEQDRDDLPLGACRRPALHERGCRTRTQNFAAASFSWPQFGQALTREAYGACGREPS